jgi:hypothetical protein
MKRRVKNISSNCGGRKGLFAPTAKHLIRFQRTEDGSADSLLPFDNASIEPKAKIKTDGWLGYRGLQKRGFDHKVIVIKDSGKKAHEVMPIVHLAVTNLKRWLEGTLQGGVQIDQLEYYLDEFTFRFNRR